MTWQSEMRKCTVNLSKVGFLPLHGWDVKDPSTRWPETLNDIAVNRVNGGDQSEWKMILQLCCILWSVWHSFPLPSP